MNDKGLLYAGIIWIISAVALAIYGILLFLNSEIPGIRELVHFISTIDKEYIYLAAFISIFIEGLYIVGSFFPGASIVMVISIFSGTIGYAVLFTTLCLIFCGWSLAGIINIYLAKIYRNKIAKLSHHEDYHVKDHVWTTWFPAFRSSYEVAQVIEGGRLIKVIISSLRVRFWATLFVGSLALFIPMMFDINNLSNNESMLTIIVVFLISLVTGIRKVKSYFHLKT